MYCIYSDKEISQKAATKEHIIPLSLGGSNRFVITVDRDSNGKIGSKIDGGLANDVGIQFLRKAHNVRGHSNKEVKVRLKSSELLGEKVQVTFHQDHVEFYDVIKKRSLEPGIKRRVTSKIYVDPMCRARFTAKTLLAAGYYVYGDLFRKYADHSSLRTYMNRTFARSDTEAEYTNLGLYDPCSLVAPAHVPTYETMKEICAWLKSSCVVIMLCQNSLIGTVGILGELIASINVPAKAEMFPNGGDYRLGHVIYCPNGNLVRKSFYDVANELRRAISSKSHICAETYA